MLLNIKKQRYTVLNNIVRRYFLFLMLSISTMFGVTAVNAADYVYISDNLRVGVRPEPISGIPPISVVFTGMRLEVHEKSEGFLRITTNKGVTGWIKDIYVTEKAPAIIQLNRFQIKYDKLKEELSQAENTTSLLEKANDVLSQQVEELTNERRDWSKERATYLASQYKESSWLWVVEVLAVLVLSFFAGIYWYKSQVMKRLGGLRV